MLGAGARLAAAFKGPRGTRVARCTVLTCRTLVPVLPYPRSLDWYLAQGRLGCAAVRVSNPGGGAGHRHLHAQHRVQHSDQLRTRGQEQRQQHGRRQLRGQSAFGGVCCRGAGCCSGGGSGVLAAAPAPGGDGDVCPAAAGARWRGRGLRCSARAAVRSRRPHHHEPGGLPLQVSPLPASRQLRHACIPVFMHCLSAPPCLPIALPRLGADLLVLNLVF